MHIISREANESILIGENTVIKVLEVFGDHVKLSIETPGAEPSYWEKVVYLDQSFEIEEEQSFEFEVTQELQSVDVSG